MTPPKSWWLRMRSLLLLAPLLVAATPSPPSLAITDSQLGFESTPLEVKQGQCVPITVQTQTLAGTGVNVGVAVTVLLGQSPQLGAFYSSGGCTDLISETLIPQGSIGKTVYYKPTSLGRVSLTATDGVLGLLTGNSRPISVVSLFTSRLEFTSVPTTPLRRGNSAQVTVTAFDETGRVAVGYAGRVVLSSNLRIPELPLDTTFEPTRDGGVRTFTLTFPEAGDYELRIQDQANAALLAESPSIQVLLPKVSVSATSKTVGTCDSTTFYLTPVDDRGQPSVEPVPISFCRPQGSTASIESVSSGALDTTSGDCITGLLQGTQKVAWNNTQAADVTFILHGAEPVGDLTISWKRMPSPLKSSFSFPGTSTTVEPTLASYSQPLPVRFELKDTCGTLFTPPNKTFSFKATSPLFITPPSQPSPGVWTAFVALESCPASTDPLLIQPAFDGTAINRGIDEPFQLSVKPECKEPVVELSLRSKEDTTLAEPGAHVEFEVKLENKGTTDFPQGKLKLATDNLTLLEAEVDGVPTALQDGGAVIPPLAAGKAVTVRITAEMPTKPGDSVRLTAMYTTAEGAPLTPLQSVILQVSDLSANVGCGSQPASLPGHLVSWFVLLLAASRPWERSRRLRRRERIGRQAPW